MVVKQGLCIKHWREEFDVGVVGAQRRLEEVEFVSRVQQQQKKQSGQQKQQMEEREIAVVKLLAGQRAGDI